MEIKISKSSSNINKKRSHKKYDNNLNSYSITEYAIRNKPIKKNYSQKTFNNRNNLKLSTYNYISKAHSERPNLKTLSEYEIEQIKNEILQKIKENKNKSVNLKINNYSSRSNNSSRINKTKITKKNKIDIILNEIEKKFEKYNKGKMAYDVYHDYQKLHFDNYNNFLQRMELYSLKKENKEKTINDYIRLNSPKISNSKKNRVFDTLINDVKIRKQKKELKEKEDLNFFKFNKSKNNLKTKRVNEKEINEIVKRLSKPKRNLKYYNNIIKDNKNDNKKDNNDININNGGKIKENKIMKSFSLKSIKKAKKIEQINNRLYKKEMGKKDIAYKLVMKNVYEFLKNSNNIKPYITNNNNDFISYDQLKQLRNKNKTIDTESINNNKEYIFKENEEDSNSEKENNNNNNKNNYKGIKTRNNFNHKNYNELFSFSGPQTNNSIHNLKISIMIDNFFSNK